MKKNQPNCPITQVVMILSDTWTMMILHYLFEGPKRFCDLERALDGISTRTLTLKLSKLISDRMAIKDTDGQYTLTKQGKGLEVVEKAMTGYQKRYLE